MCRQEWEKIFQLTHFFLQHLEISSIIFYAYVKIELRKILHVHFYNVSETEKFTTTNYVDIIQYAYTRDCTTKYVDITQCVHASFVDNTFHVYTN